MAIEDDFETVRKCIPNNGTPWSRPFGPFGDDMEADEALDRIEAELSSLRTELETLKALEIVNSWMPCRRIETEPTPPKGYV